jgi:hypothetical protein
MKLILNEGQYNRLILESPEGIDDFLDDLSLHYRKLTPEHLQKIKSDIESSGCEKIEWAPFSREFTVGKNTAAGLSLPHGVMLNNMILNANPLEIIIYILFHEIGHQYQYKKYGEEFAYKLYRNNIDIPTAIQTLKNIENTADQFGLRKCREYNKLGICRVPQIPGSYSDVPDQLFIDYLAKFRNKINEMGINTPDEIGTMIYNWIKLI